MSDRAQLSIGLGDLEEGTVVGRPNRFVAIIRLSASPGGGQALTLVPPGESSTPRSRPSSRSESTREVLAHIADPGRLRELIFPGNSVMVRKAAGSGRGATMRATPYDLVLAKFQPEAPYTDLVGGVLSGSSGGAGGSGSGRSSSGKPLWVSVDTRYPNRIFGQALRGRLLREFEQYGRVEAEYWYHKLSPWKEEADKAAVASPEVAQAGAAGNSVVDDTEGSRPVAKLAAPKPRSRMDFFLEVAPGRSPASRKVTLPPALVEVKSVTLCKDGAGLFPDAPTERGARHLHELTRGAREGYKSCAVFIAQRDDIEIVRPNREMDPAFADALREAQASGVTLLAYRCSVSPSEICLDPSPIPVEV